MNRTVKVKENEKKHIEQIDTLKGIAIFLVILGHSIIKYPINLHDNVVCEYIYKLASSVHMPLFFVISGYCYSLKTNYKDYLVKKFKRLMIPYLVFGVFDIIPRYLLSFMVNRPRKIVESLINILFYGGEYWFLYVLFIIFVIYPLINDAVENRIYLSIMLIPLSMIISKWISSFDLFQINKVAYYLSFFVVGWIIRKKLGKGIFNFDNNNKKLIIPLMLLWVCFVFINKTYLVEITCVLGVLSMYMIANCKGVSAMFGRYGKFSLQLYLLNGYFLVLSRTIIVMVLGITNPLIIVTANLYFSFFMSYLLIYRILSNIKIFRIIMGMI